jgi:L-cysteine S-thiosulfotransferase
MKNLLVLVAAALGVAGCASPPPENAARERAEQAFRGAFTHGNPDLAARVMQQDEVQRLCTTYRNRPPADVAQRIEGSQQATIVYPDGGKLMGDWRQGEKIAQDGYGFRFTDTNPKRPNGGNCYACHHLAPQEISYGTLGPSLQGYGRQRGTSEAIQRYTYAKIYNAEAFSACSNMPRLGYNKVLTPEQITHLVALLLDPESPVNR